MEIFIPIVIILFIFSLISERIANFLKLNLPEVSDNETFFGFIPGGPFRTKTDDKQCEKIRERRVFWLAFLSSLLVAFASKANLFSMLRYMEHANQTLWWEATRDGLKDFQESGFEIFAGCILTSLFISLGSKFWHDLLDLLLYSKNLKEKLADSRTYQNQSVEQVEEFLFTPEFKIGTLALEQNKDMLDAIPGVLAVGDGYINKGRTKVACLEVHVQDDITSLKIPHEVKISFASGNAVTVPVKTVVTGGMPATNALASGGGIANQNKTLGWGTAGAVVRDTVTKQQYVLSCFHVLNGGGDWKAISGNRNIIIKENGNEVQVGTLTYGCRTDELDVALATLSAGTAFSNAFIRNAIDIREVTRQDAIRETGIRVLGAATGAAEYGYVYKESWKATFRYQDNSVWELKDLIVLTKVNDQNKLSCLSKGGDSGAVVISADNHIIGMVVGADASFTYAIKMNKIAKNFDIELI